MQRLNISIPFQTNKILPKPEFLVQDPEIARKCLNKESLTEADIQRLAETVGKYYATKILVVSSISTFGTTLRKVVPLEAPVVILCNLNRKEWALMYITMQNRKNLGYEVLYKHGNGSPVSKEIEANLKEVLQSVNIVSHPSKDNSDDNFSALTCVQNLKILLKWIRKENLQIKKFQGIQFCGNAKRTQIQLHSILNVYLPQLSSNERFVQNLRAFVNNIPVDLVQDMEKYDEIVAATEDEDDGTTAERIRNARMIFFDQDKLKQFSENYCVENSTDLLIEQNFSFEMEVFKRIFELLRHLEVSEAFVDIIKQISNDLQIDYQKLISFYKVNKKEQLEQQVEDKEKSKNNFVTFKIHEMRNRWPKVTEWKFDRSAKHWKKLLKELEGKFEQSFLEKCENVFRTVDTNRKKTWFAQLYNIVDRISIDKDDYNDCVLKLDEVFCAITGGKRLRYTQILALLVFTFGGSGKLCQIQTGEGKTVIVALIAILKALSGRKVDIITSSPILANEAVKEMQDFYNVFGLSVASNVDNNNQSVGNYKADVLYGTIAGFQFDYLRDQIDSSDIRNGREFGVVILDEVDSMLLDNGEHIAQIATTFPGMENLRYLYIKIWDEITNPNWDENENNLISQMEKKVEEMKYLIPGHLGTFVTCQIKSWVKNAIHAKNHCHEFRQYRLQANGPSLEVVPIDYLNTGVAMKNLVWSAGLTQFIQLKHNVHLSFENLTSCFISNIGFIRKYQSDNIYGLSGTLGSTEEQKLLSDLYNVTFATLPTYKEKKFEEIEGVVAQSELHWKYLVASSAIRNSQNGRATLIVCKTQDDVIRLQAMFHVIEKSKNISNFLKVASVLNLKEEFGIKDIVELVCAGIKFRLRKYSSEEDVEQTKREVKPGDIILATNIAGRGTDFKTSETVEKNGGLHVCVSFLPKNKRVEEQAFGRTSRQGKSGTAQLIIKKEEVELLEASHDCSFDVIKSERDKMEAERLKEIRDVSVKELMIKDNLFEHFSRDFKILMGKFVEAKDYFVLEDYKECFALWFETNFKAIIIKIDNTNAEEEYESFKKQASDIAEGKIKHNPFNYLSTAFYYSNKLNDDSKARETLKQALEVFPNPALMHGTYIKLAQFLIDEAPLVTKRIKNIFKKLIFLKESEDYDYKEDALSYLVKAREILEQEIESLKKFLASIKNKNIFAIKFVDARLCNLKLYQQNTEEQIRELKNSKKGKEYDVIYRFKIPATVNNQVTEELKQTGLDTFFTLRKIHEIPEVKIRLFQGQIASAVVALGIGFAFPPSLPKMVTLVTSLAVDVLQELIMEILTGGDGEFDQRSYIYKKCIRLAVIAVTVQGSLVIQNKKIQLGIFAVKYIMRTCTQNMSPEFRNSYPICASVLDGVVDFIEDYQWASQLRTLSTDKWGTIWEDMRNNGLSFSVFKTLSTKVFKDDVIYYLTKTSTITNIKHVVAPLVYKYLCKRIIMQHINMHVFYKFDDDEKTRETKKLLKRKLEKTQKDEIDQIVKEHLCAKFVFNVNFTEVLSFFLYMYQSLPDKKETFLDIGGLFLEFGTMLMKDNTNRPITMKVKEKGLEVLKKNITVFVGLEFKEKVRSLFAHLSEKLSEDGNNNNVIDIVCESIAKAVFDRVFFESTLTI